MGKRCKRRDILKHVKRTVIFLYMCLSLAMVGYAYRAEDIYYCTTDAPQLLMVLGGTVLGFSGAYILVSCCEEKKKKATECCNLSIFWLFIVVLSCELLWGFVVLEETRTANENAKKEDENYESNWRFYLQDKNGKPITPWCKKEIYHFALAAFIIFFISIALALILYFRWYKGLSPFSKKKIRKGKRNPSKPTAIQRSGAENIDMTTTNIMGAPWQNPYSGSNIIWVAPNPINDQAGFAASTGYGMNLASSISYPPNEGNNLTRNCISENKFQPDSYEPNRDENNTTAETKHLEQDGVSIIPSDYLESVPEENRLGYNKQNGMARISTNTLESVISISEEPRKTDGEQEIQNLHI